MLQHQFSSRACPRLASAGRYNTTTINLNRPTELSSIRTPAMMSLQTPSQCRAMSGWGWKAPRYCQPMYHRYLERHYREKTSKKHGRVGYTGQQVSSEPRFYSRTHVKREQNIGGNNFLRRDVPEWDSAQRKRFDTLKKWLEEDPYNAIFGRSNSFLTGRGWNDVSFIPEWVRKELGLGDQSTAEASETKTDSTTRSSRPTLVYDPISQRMVPQHTRDQMNTSQIKADDEVVNIPVKPLKTFNPRKVANTEETSVLFGSAKEVSNPVDEALEAYEKKEPLNPPAPLEEWLVTEEEVAKAAQPGSSVQEGDPVADGLSAYDEQAKKETKISDTPQPGSWLVQEGFQKAVKVEDPLVATITNAAINVRDQMKSRSSEWSARFEAAALAKDSLDQLRASDIRGRMGISQQIQSNAAQVGTAEPVATSTYNLYSDPCDKTPQGLQTSFAREIASGRSLEQELIAQSAAPKFVINDACSQEPMGLQTSYAREIASGRSLEDELAKANVRVIAPVDPCPIDRKGLQTSYERELAECKNGGRKSLEEELAAMNFSNVVLHDECPRERKGLQTSYERELAECKNGKITLEEELKEMDISKTIIYDDYPLERTGLQTSYERELSECKDGRMTLEQELQKMSIPSTTVSKVSIKPIAPQAPKSASKIVKEIRNIYETQIAPIPSAILAQPLAAASRLVEGRIDGGVHGLLGAYDKKMGPSCYGFSKGQDNLEAELAAQNIILQEVPSSKSVIESETQTKALNTTPTEQSPKQFHSFDPLAEQAVPTQNNGTLQNYKILEFNPSTRSISTFNTSSIPEDDAPDALSLAEALSKLEHSSKFLSSIVPLLESFEIVEAKKNLVILRERHASQKQGLSSTNDGNDTIHDIPFHHPINPIDGTTTIPLPRTAMGNFASPTGFVNHDEYIATSPISSSMTNSAKATDSKAKTSSEFDRQRENAEKNGKVGAGRVVQTAIWATATCYLAGVLAELIKG